MKFIWMCSCECFDIHCFWIGKCIGCTLHNNELKREKKTTEFNLIKNSICSCAQSTSPMPTMWCKSVECIWMLLFNLSVFEHRLNLFPVQLSNFIIIYKIKKKKKQTLFTTQADAINASNTRNTLILYIFQNARCFRGESPCYVVVWTRPRATISIVSTSL